MTHYFHLTSEQWLELPHWEVWELIKGIFRINALQTINHFKAGTLSQGFYEVPDRQNLINNLYLETGLQGSRGKNKGLPRTPMSMSQVKESLKDPASIKQKLQSVLGEVSPESTPQGSWLSSVTSFALGRNSSGGTVIM